MALAGRAHPSLSAEAGASHLVGILNDVAREEMLHLALVSNLLTALGAAPNLGRPQLPHPARHYPPGVHVELIVFGERALRHFMYLERPEGYDLDDADGGKELQAALQHALPAMSPREIVPRGQQFATVGHLYRAIEGGLEHLHGRLGQDGLFVGPPRAQAGPADFRWQGLTKITDLASAKVALDLIIEQGEGARKDWRSAHFGRFHDLSAAAWSGRRRTRDDHGERSLCRRRWPPVE